MVAELISIGDEILIGQITNTNSVWMAQQLNLAGVRVGFMTTVSDERTAILQALQQASSRATLVIVTGGLGPTKDDITKAVLSEYFEAPLVPNATILRDIEDYFAKRGHELKEPNRLQSLVPEGCRVIRNPRGTAPGLWFTKNGVNFFSLPGVPYEMRPMISDFIIPEIKKTNQLPHIAHRTVLTIGIGETDLAELIADWETGLAEKGLMLAYLPQPGQVRLRISGSAENSQELESVIENEIGTLRALAGEHIYGFENYAEESQGMASIVSELLRERKKTLALAESCTGGYLASLLTAIPGASEVFRGAIVPYTNTAKHYLLDVERSVFEEKGAVSEECVTALAMNVREKFGADYGLSISGIAGPTGGSAGKPVGTVWIGLAGEHRVLAKKFRFGDNRQYNIITSANAAADLLRRELLGLI